MPVLPETVARHLNERLAAAGAFGDRRVGLRTLGEEAWIGLDDVWLVRVTPAAAAAQVWTKPPEGGSWTAVDVAGLDELDPHLDGIEASVRAWAGRLTVYRLRSGARYRVVRPFEDFYANAFAEGEILTFEDRSFLPYDDGHTLRFRERTLYVQGGTTLYAELGLYLEDAD